MATSTPTHAIKAANKSNLLVAVLGGRVGGNALFVVVVIVLLVPAAADDLETPVWDEGVLAFTSHGFRGVAIPAGSNLAWLDRRCTGGN